MRSHLERSRYAQIALTYTKPLPFRIWAVTTAIGAGWILLTALVGGTSDSGVQMAMLFLVASMAVWAGAMIAGHAKEQLADARASLVPGFRAPHLVVAATMFLLLVVAPVWTLAHAQVWMTWYDVWPPGYLALVLLITALLGWMGQLQTPGMVVVAAAVASPIFFPGGRALLGEIVRGGAIGIGYALLAASAAALAALWWRMARMHEETPEYGRSASPGLRLKVRMTGDPAFRRENAAGAGRIETFVRHADRFDDVANVAAAGFWTRARHWQHVIGSGRMPLFVALMLGLWVPLLHATGAPRDVGTVVALVASSMVPGQMLASIWPRRWYVLAGESLRPASRRQFVREQGAAMALEHARTWALLTAVAFSAALLFAPSWRKVFPHLMLALPLMAGTQVLIFGILVWILRYRSGWLIIWPIFLVSAIGVAALVAGGYIAEAHAVTTAVSVTLLLVVVGGAITFDAYRRWLATEFD